MIIQIAGKNFELTDAIKEHVDTVLRARFDAYEALIVKADVVLSADHNPHGANPRAQVKLNLELPGPDIVVEKDGDDLYELVNVVVGTAHDLMERRRDKGEF